MEIEWLILADSAQVVANKLYLLGGGWDRLTISKGFPFEQHCAIAVSVKVPWNETNQRHIFEIDVISEDQNTEEPKDVAKIQGQFEVGRPAGIPVGQEQRIQLAFDMGLKIDSSGIKKITASIDGVKLKEIFFHVL